MSEKAAETRNEAVSSASQAEGDHGCTSPWFAGLTCDHLYADCPNRMRGERELRWTGWWDLGNDRVDPHGTDVCGMCLHRHNQTKHGRKVSA